MHVLVATAGELDPGAASDFAVALSGGDTISVLTVIEIPRRLLHDLRGVMGEQPAAVVDRDVEYVDAPTASSGTPRGWPGDDEMISRYLENKRIQYTQPVIDAVAKQGAEANGVVVEGEDAATAILDYVASNDTEALIIGSHGQGVFQGLLGSTGTKLVRRSPVPVVLIRSAD